MRKEIQLETFPQRRVVDVANPALPGGTGIRNHDVHTTVRGNDGIESRGNRSPVGHVAPDAESIERFGGKLRAGRVEIKKNHLGATRAKGRGGGKPDRPGTAGNDDDLPLQRLRLPARELCLLERPIFDLELVALGNALEAPAFFRVRNHRNRGFRNVGGNARIFCGRPDAEHPDARHQNDARHRIERPLFWNGARIVSRKVALIVGLISFNGLAGGSGKRAEPARIGRRQNQRTRLRANDMVGRHRALPAIARELAAVDISEHIIACAMRQHEVRPGLADKASQHRRDVSGRRDCLWKLDGEYAPPPHSSQRPLRPSSPDRSCGRRLRARCRRT